ncbi:hypothetical protein JB92DRAFT_2827786 [Gautieria morchelliformis]|nr:hypothetical protein JB92DRAFT_2827786 [Gautieria morchelliformis]
MKEWRLIEKNKMDISEAAIMNTSARLKVVHSYVGTWVPAASISGVTAEGGGPLCNLLPLLQRQRPDLYDTGALDRHMTKCGEYATSKSAKDGQISVPASQSARRLA